MGKSVLTQKFHTDIYGVRVMCADGKPQQLLTYDLSEIALMSNLIFRKSFSIFLILLSYAASTYVQSVYFLNTNHTSLTIGHGPYTVFADEW